LDRTEFSLTARQLIVDGWGVGSSIQERNYTLVSARFDLLDARNSVILDMSEAYMNVKRQREIVAIATRNVASHRETLRKVELLYKGGAGTSVDVELALSRLARSEAEMRSAQGRLDLAEARFCAVANQGPPKELPMPQQPTRLLPVDVYSAVRLAMNINPAVLASIYTAQAAGAHVGVIKSRFFPRVDAELIARADNNLEGVEGSDGAFRGMAVLSYEFIAGGSDLAAYNSSVSERYKAQDKANELQRKVRERIRDAWAGYTASRDQIVHYRKNVEAQKKVVSGYIQQFKLGQRQLFNVLDAQDDLYTAQTSYVNSKYDNAIAYYRVLESVGVLNLESLI
jgi:adhesin transport system outer membrane protein